MSANTNPSITAIEKSLTPHIVAVLAGVTGVISVLHPGFQIPGGAEAVAAGVAFAGAVGIEIVHVFGYHKALNDIGSAMLWAEQQAKTAVADVAPLAPVVTQVADTTGYGAQLARIELALKQVQSAVTPVVATVQALASPSASVPLSGTPLAEGTAMGSNG